MRRETKAVLAAVTTAFAITLLGGICGAALSYFLWDKNAGGGLGAIGAFIQSVIRWTIGGIIAGNVLGIFVAWRTLRKQLTNPIETSFQDLTRGKDLT